MKVILNFQRNKEILFEKQKKKRKKARKKWKQKQSIKNLKELAFANSISFVLFQTTLFESVFLLQTLSLGIILPAIASWVFCCRVVASCFIWSSCCHATVASSHVLTTGSSSCCFLVNSAVPVASSCFFWWPPVATPPLPSSHVLATGSSSSCFLCPLLFQWRLFCSNYFFMPV